MAVLGERLIFVTCFGLCSGFAVAGGTTLYGGYGFESPVFRVGAVDGQFGWSSTGAGTPDVTQYMAHTGLQSLRFGEGSGGGVTELRADYGEGDIGFYDSPVAVVSFHVMMLESTTTNLEGSLFLNLSGSQVVGGNDSLETVGMVQFTGAAGGTGPGESVRLNYGVWSEVSIEIDLLNRQSALSLDGGDAIALEWGLGQVDDNTLGGLFFQAINSDAFGGQFFVDNLSVNTVPSPGGVCLIGFSGLIAVRRRR